MHLVAKRRLVGVALAVFKAGRRRVVLDNEVVPVDHPDLTVRTDVGLDRRRPLVVARHEAPGHAASEGGAARRDLERGHHVAGGLADEGGAVPILAGVGPGGVEPVAGRRGEPAVVVDLANRGLAVGRALPRRHLHLGASRDAAERGGVPAANPFVDAVGQRHLFARVAVGGRAEENPLLTEADTPGVVVGAPQELELRAVRLKSKEALLELQRFAADLTLEARVADHAVDPAVETPGEVARAGVRVVGAPAGEQLGADVGLPVAVGVFEKQRVGGLGDDQASVVGEHARADRERLGEHHASVERAVSIPVVEPHDPVVPFPFPRENDGVGVVDALGDEEPAVVVEGKGQRLGLEERLGGGKGDRKADRSDRVSPRRLGFEWLLHRGDRLTHFSPVGLGNVERHVCRLIVERCQAVGELRHFGVRHEGPRRLRVAAGREANAPLDEVVEAGVAPGPLVVPPGGVEHPAVALGADPCPGLAVRPLDPLFEHRSPPLVVLGMDVGLVPAGEAAKALHHRVLGSHDLGLELAGAVLLELGADHVDPDRRVLKAKTGGVQRHQALATANVVNDRRLLLGRDRLDVGKDGQRVVRLQDIGREIGEVVGVDQVDAPRGQHGLELAEPLGRLVVPPVAEKQHLDGPLGRPGRTEE